MTGCTVLPALDLGGPAWAVLAILLASMALLVADVLRYDVVAVLVVLALIATGALETQAALASFAAPAVVVLASMYVFAQGFVRFGVADAVGRRLLAAGGNPASLPFRVALVAGAFSTVVSDAAVTATLLPVVYVAARRSRLPVSKLLIPLSYGSLAGGTVTVVGTASNVAVNDVLAQLGAEPFGLVEYAPVGLVVLLAAALYFLWPGKRLLPDARERESLSERYHVPRFVTEVLVEASSDLVHRSLGDLDVLERHQVSLLGILRAGAEPDLFAPGPTNRIRGGDVLILQGEPEEILALREELGLRETSLAGERTRLASSDVHLVEAVVPAGSELAGRTLAESDFAASTNLNVLALSHHGEVLPTRVSRVRLEVGDTLLLQGHARDIERMRGPRRLLILAERRLPSPGLGGWLVSAALLAVLVAAAQGVSLAFCALAGAMALVLTRCIRPAEAVASIDWSVILLTGGLLALGRAFEQHGLGQAAARAVLAVAGSGLAPHAALAVVIAATVALTQLTTNVSAVVVMTPVALAMAEQSGLSSRPFAAAVVLAASFAFMSPVGHAANTMVAGPGGYRFRHFLAVGTPLTVVLSLLLLALIPLFWPFRA